ncbi:MAG TPA: hypothetical protein PK113_05365, partial [Bacillota bacterium]|nr:hypothetical protein [Bacillota bacterium]
MKYREIAKMAIKKYDIAVHSLTFLAEETNVFYLLGSGESAFVMKIFQEASSDINDNLTEHFLISTLLDKTEIKTPKVIRNKHGETVTKIAFPNPRGYKRVALYEYIEAEAVDGQENMEYFRTVGGLIAKMHIATENLKFPEHVNPKKWEDIFYYENETPVYHKKKYKRFITQEMISILDELIPYINEKLKLFYTNMTPRL